MNISVTNGFDLKVSQSISLNNEIEEFLKNGGEVRTVVGYTGTKKAYGYVGEFANKKPKEEKPKKQEKVKVIAAKKPKETKEEKTVLHIQKIKQEKQKRIAEQIPVLQDYVTWSGVARWSELSRASGVNRLSLSRTASGVTTFDKADDWQKVLDGIAKLKELHKKGVEVGRYNPSAKNTVKKNERSKVQVKILNDYMVKYGKRGAFARIYELTGYHPSTLASVARGKTTVANTERWEEILKAIKTVLSKK